VSERSEIAPVRSERETSDWEITVPHHAEGASQARHRLATSLVGLIPAAVLADIVAVTAELVGNAVRHAAPLPGGVVRVAWRLLRSDRIEVRVTDGGADTTPAERRVGSDSPDGRGLMIVAALSERWGIDRDGPGQCVWARVGITPTRPAAPTLAGTRV
jgi:anti-sigma regulatory factor (Ser/Thr protein kinase)